MQEKGTVCYHILEMDSLLIFFSVLLEYGGIH